MNEEVVERAVLQHLTSSENRVSSSETLSSLFDHLRTAGLWRSSSFEDADSEKESFRAVLDQMVSDGLLDARMRERDYERSYRVTDQGGYEAAGFDQLALDKISRAVRAGIDEEGPVDPDLVSSVSSADWTGISERLTNNPEVSKSITDHIRQIDLLVENSDLTNLERQKAKAITESLRLLIASPEPEWKAIAFLLTSPALTAVLNVAAIVQIILKFYGIG